VSWKEHSTILNLLFLFFFLEAKSTISDNNKDTTFQCLFNVFSSDMRNGGVDEALRVLQVRKKVSGFR